MAFVYIERRDPGYRTHSGILGLSLYLSRFTNRNRSFVLGGGILDLPLYRLSCGVQYIRPNLCW